MLLLWLISVSIDLFRKKIPWGRQEPSELISYKLAVKFRD